ncbi:response regulator transcription factor [Sporosarcina sp. P33]|uniref:response regulator transcription factor n=1 Tax=Sporosarcina sp. P33 TaxID=1930764 RepID=UPI0018C8C7F2|nr:response regulator transcription factor [Sporosarcina sp. P33]
MKTICLVEDEQDLLQILSVYLKKNDWKVLSCSNLQEASEQLHTHVDCWVVDIMLPDGSGFELLKEIKAINENTPVILISARGESIDRVIGFEIGCDDYITKPFLPAELVLRIKKILQTKPQTAAANLLAIGPYIMDESRRMIMKDHQELDITSREFDIIRFFAKHNHAAIPRELLLQQIWGDDYFGSERVVDNYIKRIRQKMPDFHIETIYGFGYRCNL